MAHVKDPQQYGYGAVYVPLPQDEDSSGQVWEHTGPDLDTAVDRLVEVLGEWSDEYGASYEDAAQLASAELVRARDPFGGFYETILDSSELARLAAKVDSDVEKQWITPFGRVDKDGKVVEPDRSLYDKAWKKGFRNAVISIAEKKVPGIYEYEHLAYDAMREAGVGGPKFEVRRRTVNVHEHKRRA